MSTIRVRLADCPTDVLVHLVDNGPASISQLVAALDPKAAAQTAVISYAVDLLRRCGYVKGNDRYEWAATSAGVKAVTEARAAASEPKGGQR